MTKLKGQKALICPIKRTYSTGTSTHLLNKPDIFTLFSTENTLTNTYFDLKRTSMALRNLTILEQIRGISTPDDMEQVAAMLRSTDDPLSKEVQQALLDKMSEVTAQSKVAREDTVATLKIHGVNYPLTDWLTPKNYAKRFGISNTETVINWINRGVIGEDDVKEIPELGLRLVRAVEYSPRKYATVKS